MRPSIPGSVLQNRSHVKSYLSWPASVIVDLPMEGKARKDKTQCTLVVLPHSHGAGRAPCGNVVLCPQRPSNLVTGCSRPLCIGGVGFPTTVQRL